MESTVDLEVGVEAEDLTNDNNYLGAIYEPQLPRYEVTKKWLYKNHDYYPRYIHKPRRMFGRVKFEKVIYSLVLLVIMGALIAWGIIIYERVRTLCENNSKELTHVKIEFEKFKHSHHDNGRKPDLYKKIQENNEAVTRRKVFSGNTGEKNSTKTTKSTGSTTSTTAKQRPKSDVIVRLAGNNQLEVSVRDTPIHSWEVKERKGDIIFDGRYIVISQQGLYYVSAQVFYGNNTYLLEQQNKNFVLDFAIVKSNWKRIASASVPLIYCQFSCTSNVHQMVYLNENDYLSVQSSHDNQTFNMFSEKTHFTIYKMPV